MAQPATAAILPHGQSQGGRNPHTSTTKLEDQAAVAALYVTKHENSTKHGREFLDRNNRLSSAGAAASLKHANPQDLPSYPSSGLKNESAAGAAATLGWAQQKPFEHWKPDPSASASAAAVLAKDYKMAPLWQPEQSTHGAKAALLAHKDGGKVDIWTPERSVWGGSAASQAFKKYGAGQSSPILDYGYSDLGRKGSLMAATGAISNSRSRAKSNPAPAHVSETYPDAANATGNALKAATSASSKSRNDKAIAGGSIPYTNLPKEMFSSRPPVSPELDELNRQNTLRASAIAMARGMYAHQQKQIDSASASAQSGAATAHQRRPSTAEIDDSPVMVIGNLQEAAQKLAQERLAKLHDEHAKNREYREHYGYNNTPQSRLSIRGRPRRRASSEGSYDEDRAQSNKIRQQMSLFSSNLSQVDEKKRQKDREALIAVAQRNVTKSLHGMDEKLFADTGKVAPSLLSEWELKAHAAAQAKSGSRMENHGKIDIGGGKFINQSAVDLVAQRNVQPVLDEINEKAQLERERQAALKAEQAEAQRKASEKKQREKEEKEINKKLKHQDKEEEKARKAEQKAIKDEENKTVKEKRKSERMTAVGTGVPSAIGEPATSPTSVKEHEPSPIKHIDPTPHVEPTPIRTSMEGQASLRIRENADAANTTMSTPMSPTSPRGGKMKTWLKNRFSRRMSKSNAGKEDESENEKRGSFVGGAALTGASVSNGSSSFSNPGSPVLPTKAKGKGPEESPKSEDSETEENDKSFENSTKRQSNVSALSSTKDEDEAFQEARDNFNEDLAPPPVFAAEKEVSRERDSKFVEQI